MENIKQRVSKPTKQFRAFPLMERLFTAQVSDKGSFDKFLQELKGELVDAALAGRHIVCEIWSEGQE